MCRQTAQRVKDVTVVQKVSVELDTWTFLEHSVTPASLQCQSAMGMEHKNN